MKINSELPNSMLEYNEQLNEYDFVLFHLYKTDENYRNYYLNMRKNHPDRLMILDNSAYEFYVKNEELDPIEYRKCICELKPDLYILPDVLMNKEITLKHTLRFSLMILASHQRDILLHCKPLAVAQGVSEEELLDCMHIYLSRNIKQVCIPFHNSFFKEMGKYADEDIQNEFAVTYNQPVNEDMLYAMGRIQFVRNNFDLLKQFEHVHFLGSHCPLEKVFYKDFNTMDTGYPVKCGIEGVELFKEISKPNIIIDEFLNKELDVYTKEMIINNVEKFKAL